MSSPMFMLPLKCRRLGRLRLHIVCIEENSHPPNSLFISLGSTITFYYKLNRYHAFMLLILDLHNIIRIHKCYVG